MRPHQWWGHNEPPGDARRTWETGKAIQCRGLIETEEYAGAPSVLSRRRCRRKTLSESGYCCFHENPPHRTTLALSRKKIK